MKLPYATLSKVLMDQIYNTYIQIRAAQDSDSDGGKKVTRKEVWDLVSNFILITGYEDGRTSYLSTMECLTTCVFGGR